jgi:acetylornithine deacetylase/succinyl-diaminopimelate desuccinylase family protein
LRHDVAGIALDLVGIGSDSCTQGERGVAKYIDRYLEDIGIEARVIEFEKGRFDVLAKIGNGEGLMLNGHMDTVPIGDLRLWRHSPEGEIKNGRLYGRGATDMKGGIAAILAALHDVNLKNPKRALLLTFVADEEVHFIGSRWLLSKRKDLFRDVKYGIIAEPTDMRMQVAQRGILSFYVETIGKGAHGSTPWKGRNAIIDAVRAISALEKFSAGRKAKHGMLGKGTINIGKISGGTATNVVPDNCRIGVDMRLVPGESPRGMLREVRAVLDATRIDYGIDVAVQKMPYSVRRNSYVIGLLGGVAGSRVNGGSGYTEADLYNDMAGMDCVVYGPGTKDLAHKADEFVSLPNLYRSTKIFAGVIGKWCSGTR